MRGDPGVNSEASRDHSDTRNTEQIDTTLVTALVTTLTLDSWSLTGQGDRRVTCALCCPAEPGGGSSAGSAAWTDRALLAIPRSDLARDHRAIFTAQAAQAPGTQLVPWEMFASKVFCARLENRTGTWKKYFRLENTISEQIT